MQDRIASQTKPNERSDTSKKIDWLNLHPVPYVMERIEQSEKGFTVRDLGVAVVVAKMMGPEGKGPSGEERQVCFASLRRIAKRAKCGKTTVQRSLKTLCDGDAPLFKRTLGGVTRGHPHLSYRFELIRNPAAFVIARGKVRHLKPTDGNFRQGGESN